jgi:hypothetical protein
VIDYEEIDRLMPNPTPPGWDLNELVDIDAESCDPLETIHLVRAITSAQAMLDGARLRVVERFSALHAGDELAQDTLALELKISMSRAGNDMSLAHALAHRLPQTSAALAAGKLDRARAAQIERATGVLTDEQAREVENRIFPEALEKIPRQLYALVRRAVLEVDPEGAENRARKRRAERRVFLHHQDDGVSWLNTLHSSEDAVAMYRHIDILARDVKTADEPRSMSQLRADVHRDLVLGVLKKRVKTTVYVTCTAETLLGLDNIPGELRDCGPFSAERIRELAFDLKAEWAGILVDEKGFPKAMATKRYRPGKRLREFVELRDRTCDHPGCGRPADLADFDHKVPYDRGGPTTADNGGPKCRRHHRAKQSRYWQVEQDTDGESIWISTITNRRYVKKPEPIAPAATAAMAGKKAPL